MAISDADRQAMAARLSQSLQVNLINQFQRALAQAGPRTSQTLRTVFQQAAEVSPGRRTDANYDLAEGARDAVVLNFDSRPNNRRTPAYRTSARRANNVRLAGGILKAALASDAMIEAGPDGFSFINENHLDRAARHWRRINFGAGAAAGQAPAVYQVRGSNLTAAALGLEPNPSPSFLIPRGYWVGGGSGRGGRALKGAGERGSEFYPVGEAPKGVRGRPNNARVTRGIAASNFLDPGIRYVAQQMIPTYTRLVEGHLNRAFRGRKPTIYVAAR